MSELLGSPPEVTNEKP